MSRWPFSVLAQVTWDQVVTWATVALLLWSRSCTGVLAEMLPYLGLLKASLKVPWQPFSLPLPHEGPCVRGVCKRGGQPASLCFSLELSALQLCGVGEGLQQAMISFCEHRKCCFNLLHEPVLGWPLLGRAGCLFLSFCSHYSEPLPSNPRTG